MDHKTEAEQAAEAGKWDIANYHATMWRTEQAKVANLITYADKWYPDARTATGDLVHSAIRDGLGIA